MDLPRLSKMSITVSISMSNRRRLAVRGTFNESNELHTITRSSTYSLHCTMYSKLPGKKSS